MTANVVRQRDGHTVVDVDAGCEPGNHRRDALCAYLPVPTLEPADEETEDEREGGAT